MNGDRRTVVGLAGLTRIGCAHCRPGDSFRTRTNPEAGHPVPPNVASKPFSGMQRIHLRRRLIHVNVGKRGGGAGAAAGERPPRSPRGRPRRDDGRRRLPGPAALRAAVRAVLVSAGAAVFFGALAAVGLAAGARLTAGPGSPSLPPGLAPPRGAARGITQQSTFVLTKGQAAMTTITSGLRAPRPAPPPDAGRPPGEPAWPTGLGRAPGRPGTVGHPRHARHPRHATHPRHAKRPRPQSRSGSQAQRKGHAPRPRHRSGHRRLNRPQR